MGPGHQAVWKPKHNPCLIALTVTLATLMEVFDTSIAMARIYRQMLQQSGILSYKNAFAILPFTLVILSPLTWIMRLPPEAAKIDPELLAGH